MTSGVKGSSSRIPEPKEQDEEVATKTKETTRRLVAEANMLLAKEAQRDKQEEEATIKDKEEAETRKKEEAILEKITKL